MTNTPSTGTRTPQPPAQLRDWRQILILGLSIGIGVAVARGVVSAFWPGQDGPLLILIRILAAGLSAGLIAAFVGWLLGIRRGTQQGKGKTT
jgi:hypothetical protein